MYTSTKCIQAPKIAWAFVGQVDYSMYFVLGCSSRTCSEAVRGDMGLETWKSRRDKATQLRTETEAG